MNMRKNIVRVLWCVALLLASVLNIHAENGIIETRHYSLCSGDTISIDTRRTPVSRDTILYDTIRVTAPDMDSIYVYVVNVYPMMIHTAERLLEAGQEIAWCDTVLRTGGTYERIYHSIHGCDSVYRIHVKVQLSRAFTLCDDESVYFNGQTYVNAGTYDNRIEFTVTDA